MNRSPLLVAVAELAAESVHQVAEDLVLAGEAEGDAVSQLHDGAGRAVVQSGSAVDGVLASLGIESLPDGPHAVDLRVVKEEHGVVGRRVEVLHLRRAAAEPVAGAVDAELVVADEALHLGLEVLDGGLAEEELGDVGVGVVAAAEVGVQIADQAAGVKVVFVLDVVAVGAVERTEVAEVAAGEGTGVDTAATGARREGDVHEAEVGVITTLNEHTVAAKRELVTVEEFTLVRCLSIAGPVPVGKRSSVAASVDEVVLPLPDEVTVPCKEIGGDVNGHGHVDVGGNVLVVARLHTRVRSCIGSGGDLLQAHDGIGEALAVLVGHLPELGADTGVLKGAGTILRTLLEVVRGDLADLLQSIATLDFINGVVLELRDASR